MRVLAIDTTTEACSAALLIGEELRSRSEEPGRGHADRILGMVGELLAEAGVALTGLDGIAACIGPGAFTGVRISVSVAQALSFGAGLPVVPVSSLEALALVALRDRDDPVFACLDARMAEVYWGSFAADPVSGVRALGPPAVGAPAGIELAVARWVGIGRGLTAYPELVARLGLQCSPADRVALPDARAVARLGALRLGAGAGIDAALLAPLYLRDQVAKTEAERGLR